MGMTHFDFYPPDVKGRFERLAAEYSFIQSEPTPWTPLRHELRTCRAALVTTSGMRLKTQHDFGADRVHGSPEYREVSVYVPATDVAFDFTAFDPRDAERDLNVIAPVDRIKELVDRNVLGGLGETFFSFFGLCDRVEALRSRAATAGRKMREEYTIDVAFIVPANFVCNQTAGLISRELEQAGISTVTLSTVREVTEQIKVPRPLFINFPFGRTVGPAHAVALQRSIVEDMVKVLRTSDRPGRIVDLPYKWQGMVD